MPRVIDLSALTPDQGFVIQGYYDGGEAGATVSSAGDINGDGFDDVIVGAPDAHYRGDAYVVFGHSGEFSRVDLGALTPLQGFAFHGPTRFPDTASSVSVAGDINGDGFDDVIIGSPGAGGHYTGPEQYSAGPGAAYIIFGHAGEFGHLGYTPADAVIAGDFRLSLTGSSVSSAGDVNGDGFDDVIVGQPWGFGGGSMSGMAFVIFGHAGEFSVDLNTLTPAQGFVIQGDAVGDLAGSSVSQAGDVNGDGFDDVIVGATNGGGTGEAYVLFGHAGPFANIDLTALTRTQGFIIHGDGAGDRAGIVAAAGDLNGDGFDDVIVGAPNGDSGNENAGEAYVIFGHAGAIADVDLASLRRAQGFVIQSDTAGSSAGWSVSSAGDVNGDGFVDLIIGAPWGTDAGQAYVIYGHAGSFGRIDATGRRVLDLTDLAPADGFVIEGDAAGDGTGWSVASAGDVNGDGFADVIVGAPGADDGGSNAGEAYVIFGKATAPVTRTGTVNTDSLYGGDFDDLLRGLAGADALYGRAGDDVLRGGTERDTLLGGDGADLLDGGVGKDTMTGGAGRDVFQFRDGDMGATRPLADTITDFSHADREKINLQLVDANTALAGDQAFAWIGSGGFTGVAGQLHYALQRGNTYIEGDTNGDGVADFSIMLAGVVTPVAGDFVL